MENRFGVKDLILITLLVAVIVMVGLAMKQFDRQWEVVQQVQHQSDDQLHELIRLERILQGGVRTASQEAGRDSTEPAGVDPFFRIKEIEKRPDYARGDWFVTNLRARVPKLTPLISVDVAARSIQNHVAESLTYRDPYTLEYLPLLATSWTQTSNLDAWQAYVDARLKQGHLRDEVIHEPDCPPAMAIKFQLRQGVEFSDGEPFTADDVVFTYDLVMNPKIEAPRLRAYFDEIKSLKKLGDYEVEVEFREPYFLAMEVASLQVLPKHFYSKFMPDEFNNSAGLLMGTGPYKLANPESWTPGQDKIELVRNDRYWGEPGSFDRLVYREVQGEAVDLTMFKNGETDQFAALPEQYRALLQDQAVQARTRHFEFNNPTGGYSYIGWNENRKGQPTVFSDKRVRQALTLLINRQKICDEIFYGYATPASGPFQSISVQHDPAIKPWPFDSEKGKTILAELGFTDRDGSGVLSNAAGQQLRFKLTYPSKQETFERVILLIKDDLAKAGVVLEPDPTDWPIMLQKLKSKDFDAITLSWSSALESDIYQIFHSSQIKDGGDDYVSYANPELDKLIEQARSEMNTEKRLDLWKQCERILHDDQPYTFLVNGKALAFFDKRIQNIEPSKLGLNYNSSWSMPNPWYVPADQRKWSK